ncbi:very-short-patch-repair endonuclease [Luteibacter sp. HA06]
MDSNAGGVSETSIFQSSLPLADKLEQARTELLDLSARNRLLNMPRGARARSITVVDEKSAEVFRLLSREGKAFTFVAGRAADESALVDDAGAEKDEIDDLAQPDDESTDERGIFRRHADTKLQTRLTGKGLQKRLLELYLDSRTLEEEQGVNVLFLTLGALKWIDPNNAANIRFAPLILVPVSLDRGTAGERFKVKARQEDIASNLSLEAYLDRVHALRMPAFEANDSFDIEAYFSGVRDTIQSKEGWEVVPDEMSIGFFSFAKFLMYRDLDPAVWPKGGSLVDRTLIRGLLAEGFPGGEGMLDENANIDPVIPPVDMLHIMDCDSSQALAIHEVRRGRDLVIQGPPGTGKSQTIANIIASAIKDGKTVLFVAEKMAALDVVKRRLDEKGVGDACLELHSNKANKRAVLDELRRTWELGAPRAPSPGSLIARLTEARDDLNDHAVRLHKVDDASGLSAFQVMAQLTRLRQTGVEANDLELVRPETWGEDGFARRRDLLADLVDRIQLLGIPADHAWVGVGLEAITPADRDRLIGRVEKLATLLASARSHVDALAVLLEADAPRRLTDLPALAALARRIAGAPALTASAMSNDVWHETGAIDAVLFDGRRYEEVRQALSSRVREPAWTTDVSEARLAFSELPPGFGAAGIARLREVADAANAIVHAGKGLAHALGRETPPTTTELLRLAKIGERVASAPPASPETFASELWDGGVERAGELASAVSELEGARSAVGGQVTDVAWDIDVAAARSVLAAKGNSLLRHLSGQWRQANRLMRSVITTPNPQLPVVLALLDALTRGQAARKTVRDEDAFGRSAFGEDWRGEKSHSAPLVALVEWMRSLRGLGAEPRLLASKGPEKDDIAVRSKQLAGLVAQHSPLLSSVWDDFAPVQQKVFGAAAGPEQVDLESLVQLAVRHTRAYAAVESLTLAMPATAGEVCTLLQTLADGQAAMSSVQRGDAIGKAAFDGAWGGLSSDWGTLSAAADWTKANPDIRALAGRVGEREGLLPKAKLLDASGAHVHSTVNAIAGEIHLDLPASVGAPEVNEVLFDTLAWRLNRWVAEHEELHRWVNYRDRAMKASSSGCADVVARLADGRLTAETVLGAFEMAYFEGTYARMVRTNPALGRFDGIAHGRRVREFADLDRQRIVAAAAEVVKVHHQGVPMRDSGSVGPLGILRGEIQKKKGHMPIRKLVEKAAPALRALKPVFMMSPLSVAQFLPPGTMEFDLLVMDEASQIQPVDALGAVARAKQVVVVGDPRQLPPTSFFAKMTSVDGDEDDEDDATRVTDIESILGLFTARGLPMRMLRWHYRSRHQSLIAVSNKQFYESKLFIVPSPYTVEGGRGLVFNHVRDGVFDTGGKRVNAVEAKRVAEAIVHHARTSPKRSLGVAAFSASQRRAIIDELELLRRGLPLEVEEFFKSGHRSEPFFIKNLENVQGDERDVMFISVGYGPTVPGGRVPMRFGPLGTEGGERRLNVLISRAKQRCEVFASMTDEDIDPGFSANRKGIEAFRIFLRYARTGLLDTAEVTGKDFDSLFEEQVANALEARGYTVQRQVGLAGFFIDLAITDPERPGRFLLGIECDGAAYHDAQSARDRDRLRQQVLEDHGWNLHRIWSTDWFQRPAEQLELACRQIEAARKAFDEGLEEAALAEALDQEGAYVERESVPEEGAIAFPPYVEASLVRPPHRTEELHEVPMGVITQLVVDAVSIEGPVHADEVISRIRDAWGVRRAGSRIQLAVNAAIEVAVAQRYVVKEGDFLSLPESVPTIRDRSEVESIALRKPDMLPPAELAAAVVLVVERNFGASRSQVIERVARAVGVRAISAQVRERISDVVDSLIQRGAILESENMLAIQV